MAIFSRNKEVQNQINEPTEQTSVGNLIARSATNKKYSDSYVWTILKTIFGGLQNVRYYMDCDPHVVAGADPKHRTEAITDFLNTNASALVWLWWEYGYIVVEKNALGKLYIPDYSRIKTDRNRKVKDYDNVIYSDAYRYEGKSDFAIIKEHIDAIDTLKDAELYLTESLGAFGIFSGTSTGVTPADKDAFLESIKKRVGIGRNKFQFMLMQSEVKLQQVDLHIKDLELAEKIKDEIKLLAGYFNVPYDLIPFSGQSTYANQEQAVVNFYRNCIAPLAEVLLSVGRYLLKKETQVIIPSDKLTFAIDNVNELMDDEDKKLERMGKAVEIAKTLHDMGEELPEDLRLQIYGK